MLWKALARAAGYIAKRYGRATAKEFVKRVAYRAASRTARTASEYWRGVHRSSEAASRELLDASAHIPVSERVAHGIGAVAGVSVLGGGAYAYSQSRVMAPPHKRPRPGDDPYYPGERVDRFKGTIGLIKSRYHSNRMDPMREVKLVKAAERYAIYTYRGLNQWNSVTGTNKGYNTLALRWSGTVVPPNLQGPLRHYPVHIYNLTALPNGAAVTTTDYQASSTDLRQNPYVAFELTQAQTSNARAPALRWDPQRISGITLSGVNSTFVSNPSAWSLESISDQGIDYGPTFGVPATGRKHWLDWIDMRLMVYGKRRHDTEVTMRIIRMTEDKFCPEYFATAGSTVNSTWLPQVTGTGATAQQEFSDCSETLKGLVDGLVNNPISNRPSVGRTKWYNTLFQKTFRITSKDTSEANTDVNVEMFKFFKRYNWLRDHSVKFNSPETAPDILNEQTLETQRVDFGAQPSRLRDNIYLLLTSKTPHDYADADLTADAYTDFQTSYDLIIRKKVVHDLI